MFKVEVKGLEEVKRAFADVGYEFKNKQLAGFLQAQGKAVVRVARSKVNYDGEIARLFKRDLGVSAIKGSVNNPYILAGPKFIQAKGKHKVAPIAQHLTVGFNQSNRTGAKSGVTKSARHSRGKIRHRVANPMFEALVASSIERQQASDKEMRRKINSIKRKNQRVFK